MGSQTGSPVDGPKCYTATMLVIGTPQKGRSFSEKPPYMTPQKTDRASQTEPPFDPKSCSLNPEAYPRS